MGRAPTGTGGGGFGDWRDLAATAAGRNATPAVAGRGDDGRVMRIDVGPVALDADGDDRG